MARAAVRDVGEIIRPHPSMRGGAGMMRRRTRGRSMGGDVARMVRGGVAKFVGVAIDDERALAWPVWAMTRGNGSGSGGEWWW